MTKARFQVKDVFEVRDRGRVVSGTILDGTIRIGDRLVHAGMEPIRVTSVEFVDTPATKESHVALVFADAPPLSELRPSLPAGAVLECAD